VIYGPPLAKVLLVGEAPSRELHTSQQLHLSLMSPALADLAGVGFPGEWARLFRRTNLLESWPGRAPSGRGDLFDARAAAESAGRLIDRGLQLKVDLVVLLGRRVERAFGRPRVLWFAEIPALPWRTRVAPHPSRISRWWNDEENRSRARSFWSDVAAVARGGQVV
jgi:uracil-DNA glycosylase